MYNQVWSIATITRYAEKLTTTSWDAHVIDDMIEDTEQVSYWPHCCEVMTHEFMTLNKNKDKLLITISKNKDKLLNNVTF